ncbi:MAG: hypothetical protein HYU87_05370 [Chloroflexi bacterium]|nr:hypothetical protein [Chloroflexota bacterium]
MTRRKLARAAGRVSVPVRDDIRVEAPKRPDLLGLPSGASRARVFERLLERGWQAVLTEQRDRRQLDLYAAYARDPERQAVARADQQELVRSRVF